MTLGLAVLLLLAAVTGIVLACKLLRKSRAPGSCASWAVR